MRITIDTKLFTDLKELETIQDIVDQQIKILENKSPKTRDEKELMNSSFEFALLVSTRVETLKTLAKIHASD